MDGTISMRPPSSAAGEAVRPSGRLWLVALGLVALFTAMRIFNAAWFEVRTDEAYYWTWSKETTLSFLDHPPMIAWVIKLGTAIFGDTSLGVRVGGVVAMAVTELLIADIVRRVTRDLRAALVAVLMCEAALYYGLLMAKSAPDVALIPFATAMIWSLIRLAGSGNGRWWLAAGLFGGLALLSKYTAVLLLPSVAAFALVPDWRRRWLASPYPYLALIIAIAVFSPVLIWNAANDWASFRFQFLRAAVSHGISLATLCDFFALQFIQVGPILLPVVVSGVAICAWRGWRQREPVALLLSTAVIVPFAYFLARSLTLRIGDTWPMFMWPPGFAAVAINLAVLRRDGAPLKAIRAAYAWVYAAIASGAVIVAAVFLYALLSPVSLLGASDPIGAENGFAPLAARALDAMHTTGATWIATSDYRTYAVLRWQLHDSVPVIQINERARFIGFHDPGLATISGHAGLYVAPVTTHPEQAFAGTTAVVTPLATVPRTWRGVTIQTYTFAAVANWTPDLNPPPTSPLYRWRPLAGLPPPCAGAWPAAFQPELRCGRA